MLFSGSSPRAWGTQSRHRLEVDRRRFIPTRVGNTYPPSRSGASFRRSSKHGSSRRPRLAHRPERSALYCAGGGLYSSHLVNWRRQYRSGAAAGLAKRRGPKGKDALARMGEAWAESCPPCLDSHNQLNLVYHECKIREWPSLLGRRSECRYLTRRGSFHSVYHSVFGPAAAKEQVVGSS